MNIKKHLGPAALALGLALVMNTAVRAAEMSFLKLPRNMVIAGVDLRAGTYTVQWKIQGTRATVIFFREGRTVATVQGEYKKFDRSVTTNTLYFSKNTDDFLVINALGFAGTNKGILFPTLRSRSQQPSDLSLDNLLVNRWNGNNALTVPRVHK